MKEYHKIQSIYKRDEKTHQFLIGQFSRPEFEYLQNNQWVFTEKVDGTNIRVMWDGTEIKFGGKSDNAQTPMDLIRRLDEIFKDKTKLFKSIFPDVQTEVCLYGEGYGAGIQKGGGNYKKTKDFVLFDVKIGQWWLRRYDVQDIALKLELDVVPIIRFGTLHDAMRMAQNGFNSCWGDFLAEGIVLRPDCELIARNGQRIITKVKHKDFK
jgi:hypothetical protein